MRRSTLAILVTLVCASAPLTVTHTYHVAQNLGFDPVKKQFVAASFDNSGSSYSTGTSAGWKGDTITFDETSAMDRVNFRDTFTRNGAKGLTHTGTMQDKNGKWVKTDDETCQKA